MLKNFIVCLSGGLDSAVVCGLMKKWPHKEMIAVSFEYGSKHNALELKAADKVAAFYTLEHVVLDVREVFSGFRSALMDPKAVIPEGHYNDESMSATVVPMRNVIFASVLASFAMNRFGSEFVSLGLGVHEGDSSVYPDCRPETIEALAATLANASEGSIGLFTPLLGINKAEIVESGLYLKVPFTLTRTCYTNNETACGLCGSCNERIEAFRANNAMDPVPYNVPMEW